MSRLNHCKKSEFVKYEGNVKATRRVKYEGSVKATRRVKRFLGKCLKRWSKMRNWLKRDRDTHHYEGEVEERQHCMVEGHHFVLFGILYHSICKPWSECFWKNKLACTWPHEEKREPEAQKASAFLLQIDLSIQTNLGVWDSSTWSWPRDHNTCTACWKLCTQLPASAWKIETICLFTLYTFSSPLSDARDDLRSARSVFRKLNSAIGSFFVSYGSLNWVSCAWTWSRSIGLPVIQNILAATDYDDTPSYTCQHCLCRTDQSERTRQVHINLWIGEHEIASLNSSKLWLWGRVFAGAGCV